MCVWLQSLSIFGNEILFLFLFLNVVSYFIFSFSTTRNHCPRTAAVRGRRWGRFSPRRSGVHHGRQGHALSGGRVHVQRVVRSTHAAPGTALRVAVLGFRSAPFGTGVLEPNLVKKKRSCLSFLFFVAAFYFCRCVASECIIFFYSFSIRKWTDLRI